MEEDHAMDKPKKLEIQTDGDLTEIKKDPVWKSWLEAITKPIPDSKGGKGSFQHCINANQDKHNPGGWCKQIERKIGKGLDPGDDTPRRHPHDDPSHGDEHRRGRKPDKEGKGRPRGKRPPRQRERNVFEEDDIPESSFQNTRGMKLEEKPDPQDKVDRLRKEPFYGNVALPRVERKPTEGSQTRISQLGSDIQDKKLRRALDYRNNPNAEIPDIKELRSDADRATISAENAEKWKSWLAEKARQTKIDRKQEWGDKSKIGRAGDIDQKTGRYWWEVVTEEEERKKRERKKAKRDHSNQSPFWRKRYEAWDRGMKKKYPYLDMEGKPFGTQIKDHERKQQKEQRGNISEVVEASASDANKAGEDAREDVVSMVKRRKRLQDYFEGNEKKKGDKIEEPESDYYMDAGGNPQRKEKTDYFVEEIRSNIIYHNKILPILGVLARGASMVGRAGLKIGDEILSDMKEVGQGAMQGIGDEAEEEEE